MNRILALKDQITYDHTIKVFTVACFLFPPVFGSAVSFVFIGGAIWSLWAIATRRVRPNIDPPMTALTIAIYAYCGAYLIASIANNSFERDAPYLLSLVTFAVFPISYSTWSIIDKPVLKRLAVLSSMVACYGAVLLAIVQYYFIRIRAEGAAGNAIVFATVVCLAMTVCLAGALSGREDAKPLLAGAWIAGAIAIVYSGSRIIWIAAPIVTAIVLLIYWRQFNLRHPIRFLLTVVTVAALASLVGFHTVAARIDALFANWTALAAEGDYNTTLGLRIALWHLGSEAFQQAPLFGHGAGATEILIRQGLTSEFDIPRGFSHFHNGFLTALVEAGILGAITLAAIFAVALYNAAKVLRSSADPVERFGAAIIVIAVVTYLIAGMTGILVGHDILDTVLMIFLVSGTYLASGTSAAGTYNKIRELDRDAATTAARLTR